MNFVWSQRPNTDSATDGCRNDLSKEPSPRQSIALSHDFTQANEVRSDLGHIQACWRASKTSISQRALGPEGGGQ